MKIFSMHVKKLKITPLRRVKFKPFQKYYFSKFFQNFEFENVI